MLTNGVTLVINADKLTDRLGKKVRPGTLGEIYATQLNGSTQKVPLSKSMNFAVTPVVPTSFVPFPKPAPKARSGAF